MPGWREDGRAEGSRRREGKKEEKKTRKGKWKTRKDKKTGNRKEGRKEKLM